MHALRSSWYKSLITVKVKSPFRIFYVIRKRFYTWISKVYRPLNKIAWRNSNSILISIETSRSPESHTILKATADTFACSLFIMHRKYLWVDNKRNVWTLDIGLHLLYSYITDIANPWSNQVYDVLHQNQRIVAGWRSYYLEKWNCKIYLEVTHYHLLCIDDNCHIEESLWQFILYNSIDNSVLV